MGVSSVVPGAQEQGAGVCPLPRPGTRSVGSCHTTLHPHTATGPADSAPVATRTAPLAQGLMGISQRLPPLTLVGARVSPSGSHFLLSGQVTQVPASAAQGSLGVSFLQPPSGMLSVVQRGPLAPS